MRNRHSQLQLAATCAWSLPTQHLPNHKMYCSTITWLGSPYSMLWGQSTKTQLSKTCPSLHSKHHPIYLGLPVPCQPATAGPLTYKPRCSHSPSPTAGNAPKRTKNTETPDLLHPTPRVPDKIRPQPSFQTRVMSLPAQQPPHSASAVAPSCSHHTQYLLQGILHLSHHEVGHSGRLQHSTQRVQHY